MSKFQIVAVILAALLFLVLYVAVPTRPKERKQIDKTRTLQAEQPVSITIEQLLKASKGKFEKEKLEPILSLEKTLETADETQKSTVLKSISSEWNKLDQFAIGGFYAEEVAKIEETGTAWSIAGTTYYTCFQQAKDSLVRAHCIDKAISDFESAISLEPDNQTHRVNLGLCYVNGSQNPMKGILMIREIAEKHPENTLASITLGKLSLRTNQLEKALQRFQSVIDVDPKNADAHFLVGQTYLQKGDKTKATEYFKKCLSFSNDLTFQKRVTEILNSL